MTLGESMGNIAQRGVLKRAHKMARVSKVCLANIAGVLGRGTNPRPRPRRANVLPAEIEMPDEPIFPTWLEEKRGREGATADTSCPTKVSVLGSL